MNPANSVWEEIGTAPESLADWATQKLSEVIVLGELPPGEPLVIKTLSQRLGISVTPLREALQRLTTLGLVMQRNRRAWVAPLSHAELADIDEMRQMLEPLAVERSIGAADDAWVGTLSQAYDDMASAAQRGAMAFELAHRKFHLTLISCCPSPYLRRFVGSLLDGSSRYRMLAIKHADYSSREHEQLYEAARRRDKAAARKLALDHIVHLTQSQVAALEERGLLRVMPATDRKDPEDA
jgi:DNA-binding GntR family transcriptional regulator